jgi:hypothetical protein
MKNNSLCTLEETDALIKAGKVLLIAGEEELLERLSPGSWIGGTAVNFIDADGGVTNREQVFVTDLSPYVDEAKVRRYDVASLPTLANDYCDGGFSVLIVPGMSEAHSAFARDVQSYPGVFNAPLIGWVSAVHLSEIGAKTPKAFAGSGDAVFDAVALHVRLKPEFAASIDIINLFAQGDGDVIEFEQDGFVTTDTCRVNGQRKRLSAYIAEKNIDTRLPLVADFFGAMINVSVQSVDDAKGAVTFYAPVFKGVSYRFAAPVPDYTAAFDAFVTTSKAEIPAFSCNCILNYEYANLEGKKTGEFTGPITFGEIAYMLLNQTLVRLDIVKAA